MNHWNFIQAENSIFIFYEILLFWKSRSWTWFRLSFVSGRVFQDRFTFCRTDLNGKTAMLIGCIRRNFTFLPAHWLQKLGRFYRLMDITFDRLMVNFEGMATNINIWWFHTGERVVQHWGENCHRLMDITFDRLMDINFEGMATNINIWCFHTGERVVQHWGENCPYINLSQTLSN